MPQGSVHASISAHVTTAEESGDSGDSHRCRSDKFDRAWMETVGCSLECAAPVSTAFRVQMRQGARRSVNYGASPKQADLYCYVILSWWVLLSNFPLSTHR